METMGPLVQHDVHRHLLDLELQRAKQQGVIGVLLCGSVARGTARPVSDLDLRLFWPESRPFEATWHAGVLIERHGHSIPQAMQLLERSNAQLYPWIEGQILHDPTGTLAILQVRARELMARYQTPAAELQSLQHWLETALLKLKGATSDTQRAFLVQTTTWKLAEGMCAVNGRPVPPSTLMWELLPTFERQPGEWLTPLLLGTLVERIAAFHTTATWLLPRLSPGIPEPLAPTV